MRWRPITPNQPAPLVDVLVSAFQPGDDRPYVFTAYRRHTDPSQWLLSGSDCERLVGVYAWAPEPKAAPLPAELQPAQGPRIVCTACGEPTDSVLSPVCADCAVALQEAAA